MILLHPAYFGPIDQFSAMLNAEKLVFEHEDNYQKQTYRNRQYIYGANGKLPLTIPIKHVKDPGHQKYKDVKIDYSSRWQLNHWRSLQTAYRTSPFFEYYEDDFAPLYEKSIGFLLDFNYHCLETFCDCFSLKLSYSQTEEYILNPKNLKDLRSLISAKRGEQKPQKPYSQVFQDKYGFLENLSVLDLLFNEGPNTLDYLKGDKVQL